MFYLRETYYLVSVYISGVIFNNVSFGVPTFANSWTLRKYIFHTRAVVRPD